MAAKHPKSVLAAVETLATANPRMTSTEIRNILAAGKFPELEPYELPESTARYHAARARRELQTVPMDVNPEEITDALERKSIARIRDDIRRIHAKSVLTSEDHKTLRECHRTLAGISGNRARRNSRNTQRAASGKVGQESSTSALVTKLGEAMAAEPVPDEVDHSEAGSSETVGSTAGRQ